MRLVTAWQPVDVVLVPGGEVEQHADHDERQHRIQDLDRQVVPDLLRQLITALAVEDDRPQDAAPDDDPDGPRRDPGPRPHMQDDLTLLGDRNRQALTGKSVGLTAGGDHGQSEQHGRERQPAPRSSLGTHRLPSRRSSADLRAGCLSYRLSCKQYNVTQWATPRTPRCRGAFRRRAQCPWGTTPGPTDARAPEESQ